MHNLHKGPSHSAPYKPHGVGTRKHFFASKLKKNKKFMIFDPKKGGLAFFDIPPPPPTLPQKVQNVSFKWGRARGPDQKVIGGCNNSTSDVGYVNGPKKGRRYTGLLSLYLTTSAK